MARDGTTTVVDNGKDMYNLMILTAVAIMLFLYSKVLQNRQHWIYLETALGVVYTLLLPFIGKFMSYLVGKTSDDMMVYLLRLILVSLIAQAAAVYFTKDSVDRTVLIAVSISNILIRGPILLMEVGLAVNGKAPEKMKGYISIDSLCILLLLAGDIYYLVNSKTKSYSHRTVGDPVSFHLSVDAMVNFLLGSMILGFPDIFLSVIAPPTLASNLLYSFLAKVFGIFLLGGSLLSFASLAYRDDDDAVATLKTRLVVYLSAGLLALTNILVNSDFRTFGHTGIMFGVMGGLALNVGLMVYKHEYQD